MCTGALHSTEDESMECLTGYAMVYLFIDYAPLNSSLSSACNVTVVMHDDKQFKQQIISFKQQLKYLSVLIYSNLHNSHKTVT